MVRRGMLVIGIMLLFFVARRLSVGVRGRHARVFDHVRYFCVGFGANAA